MLSITVTVYYIGKLVNRIVFGKSQNAAAFPDAYNYTVDEATRLNLERSEAENRRRREDLATVYRGLDYYGYNQSICNHLTMRAPARDGQGDVMLVISHGQHWSEVTPSSLLGVNMSSGHVVEGEGKVQIEALGIHMDILEARPDIVCCLHAHPTYSTAIGLLEDQVFKMCHQNDCMFYNDFAYHSDFGGTGATKGEGKKLAQALGEHSVLFMCNHGVAVVSKSLPEAFYKLYHLEWCCKYQMVAMATGRKLLELPDDVSRMTHEQSLPDVNHEYGRLLLDALKRIFDKQDPGYLER